MSMYGATDAPHLLVKDIPNAALHIIRLKYPDGRVMNIMQTITLKATTEKEKKKLRVLGLIQSQDKSLGTNHSAEMTVYDISSEFRRIMQDYEATGEDIYLEMTIESIDKTTSLGTQSQTLVGVNFNSVEDVVVDINGTEAQTSIPFTYWYARLNNEYDELDGLF